MRNSVRERESERKRFREREGWRESRRKDKRKGEVGSRDRIVWVGVCLGQVLLRRREHSGMKRGRRFCKCDPEDIMN